MSEFQGDWGKTLSRLPLWRTLGRETRQTFLAASGSETRPAAGLGEDLPCLEAQHWIELSVERTRARPSPDLGPFIRLLRALARAPVLSDPKSCPLEGYIRTHFNTEERMSLAGLDLYERNAAPSLIAASLSSISALNGFLALTDAAKFEERRLAGRYHAATEIRPRLLRDPSALRGAQTLLRLLMDEPSPLRLDELRWRWDKDQTTTLGGALEPLLSYGLALIDLDTELIPQIGIAPAIRDRIHRPAAAAPSVRTPHSTLSGVLALEDVETLILELITEPARMKQDEFELFARAAARLGAALRSPPAWIDRASFLSGANLAERLFHSLVFAELLGLTKVERRDDDIPYLIPTKAGQSFLREPRTARAELVLQIFRLDRIPVPTAKEIERLLGRGKSGTFDLEGDLRNPQGSAYSSPIVFDFFPTLGWEVSRLARVLVDFEARTSVCPVRDALVEAFTSLECEHFQDWHEWIECHTRTGNPFLANPDLLHEPGMFVSHSAVHLSEERLELHWGRLLELIAGQVLLPLGGLEAGIDAEDRICVRMTELGSWLLGRRSNIPLEEAEFGGASILVQPNFDVVFLSPAPGEEAALASFAERRGRGVGTLFSITRASCLAAASAGMRAEEALAALERVAKKGIPTNVASEVKVWFAQARVVELRKADIIVCPDEETAAKVMAIGGTRVRRLSELVVEVLRGKPLLVRTLREKGVFVGAMRETPPPPHASAPIASME